MRRREFITLVGGAVALPLVAHAQQQAIPKVGFLHAGSPEPLANIVAAFSKGLNERGYIEGLNVAIEYRWAEGHYDRLPALAADLVSHQVAVIFAAGGSDPTRAAKAATSTIPIVFETGVDPVQAGLVASLNRPGGNVTGVSLISSALDAKKLGLLHELVPKASVIAVLVNPNYPAAKSQMSAAQESAREIRVKLVALTASREEDIDAAFAILVQQGAGALLVGSDPFFGARRSQLVAMAALHKIPAMYFQREFAALGGLISYGPNFADAFHECGIYVGRVLKGEKPADLPIVQPTKFEMVINLKTAKALGLEVPPGLLALSDEVIE